MFNIILFEPEIPPNTGNIIRLAANTGLHLHLIEPLGFSMDAAQVRRGGLDYRDLAVVRTHASLDACLQTLKPTRVFALSTHGRVSIFATRFEPGDTLLFGPESRGLPEVVREDPTLAGVLRIPMRPDSRSLNLANAVAVCAFEALRQTGLVGLE